MFIVDTIREETERLGFKYEYLDDVHMMLHVDSITSKVMLVPHHESEKSATHMCGINMWETI